MKVGKRRSRSTSFCAEDDDDVALREGVSTEDCAVVH